jgi:proline iminopeptidase
MFAQVNHTTLYFQTRGQGRPMLMMHGGLGLDHTYFLPWFDPLCAQTQLIYYDHRGNGRSDRPESMAGISHDTWIADADALRAHLGHERIILFGHSYGGFLAQEYALEYGDHLAGLILCSTAPAVDYPDVILANGRARGTAEQLKAFEVVLSGAMKEDAEWQKLWMTYLPLYFKKYDSAVGAIMDRNTVYSVAALNQCNAHCLPAFTTLDRLSEISVPTLVISGTDDWMTPVAQGAERIHARLPNSELVLLDESGHFPFVEETDRFMQVVGDWIAGLDQTRPQHEIMGSAVGAKI